MISGVGIWDGGISGGMGSVFPGVGGVAGTSAGYLGSSLFIDRSSS